MKRLHLWEFNECQFMPQFLRREYSSLLSSLLAPAYRKSAYSLLKVMKRTDTWSILDIGSGDGDYWKPIADELAGLTTEWFKVSCSDKYWIEQNSAGIQTTSSFVLERESEPIDAMRFPVRKYGLVTCFSLLHQLRPSDARTFIHDVVSAGNSLVVFEVADRSFKSLIAIFASWLALFFFIPFIKPFSFGRFVFFYLIPILSLAYLWDAIISQLRAYTDAEVRELSSNLDDLDNEILCFSIGSPNDQLKAWAIVKGPIGTKEGRNCS